MQLAGTSSVLSVSLGFTSAVVLSLALSSTLSLALSLTQTSSVSASETTQTVPLVYHFPNVAGFGTLETILPEKSLVGLDRLSTNKIKLADAVGTVKLRCAKDQVVFFRPGLALVRNPPLLSAISPDNIYHFRFSFTSACDAEDVVADNLISRISHLNKLCSIGLSSCDVSDAGVKGIHDLPKLEQLDLGRSLVTDKSFPVIGKLLGLQYLALDGLDLRNGDMSEIAKLPKLTLLRLHGSQIRDQQIGALKLAKGLAILDLSNNPKITDTSLTALAALPALSYLNVSDTSVTIAALKKLPHVRKIIVAERDLKGVSLKQVQKVIKNIDFDADAVQNSKVIKPGKEELHLFAPTRF